MGTGVIVGFNVGGLVGLFVPGRVMTGRVGPVGDVVCPSTKPHIRSAKTRQRNSRYTKFRRFIGSLIPAIFEILDVCLAQKGTYVVSGVDALELEFSMHKPRAEVSDF